MHYQFDPDKAAENLEKHGVSFDVAIRIFEDLEAQEIVDDREDYGEVRLIVVGLINGLEYVVICTLRQEEIRLISARKAERYEREIYWKNRTHQLGPE